MYEGPGIYEHYKGNKYEVIGTGLYKRNINGVQQIIYKPLGINIDYFIRSIEDFDGMVYYDMKEKPRFKLVKPKG